MQLKIEHMTDEWIEGGNYSEWDVAKLRDEVIRLRNKQSQPFLYFVMTSFTIIKLAMVVGGVVIAMRVNMWMGAALFVLAIFYRVTWMADKQEEK